MSRVPQSATLAHTDLRRPGDRSGAASRSARWVRENRLLCAAILGGVLARVVFWVVTDRRFEDALITIKHAKNLVDGNGLVHHFGDGPVHGFTSALSVLVPLPGELIATDGGFVAMRLASLVAFVVAAVYANRIALKLELGPFARALILAYLAFDELQIFFGMAGMETQIAVAVLLAGIYYVWEEDYTKAGVALGLAILARPDLVLWTVPAFVFLVVRNREGAARAWLGGVATVAPWLIFATIYYGSPIPNTIEAKSRALSIDHPALTDIGEWPGHLSWLAGYNENGWELLAPFLQQPFVFEAPLPHDLLKVAALSVLALAVLGAVATWRYVAWRAAIAFVALFAAYKFFQHPETYFVWYFPPALAILVMLAAAGLDRATKRLPPAGAVLAVALALLYAMHMPWTFPHQAKLQHDIEDRVRVPLGEYLAQVVPEDETIVSESAGYVGYYTNANLLDYPGLTSETVGDALEDAPEFESLCGTIALLRPDWSVLRSDELDGCRDSYPETLRAYDVERRFAVSLRESSLRVGGLDAINADRHFVVLRRRGP